MLISNIVVADDGSDHAVAAVEMAIDLTLKFGAILTIVHVLTHDHPPEEQQRLVEVEHLAGGVRSQTETAIAEERVITVLGEQIVKKAIDKAMKSGVENVSTSIRSGDYATRILDVAEEKNADMIVMGRRGLSNLKGLLLGSVSQKVSQRADCSVLTVK